MRISAEIYNYSTQEMYTYVFPMSEERLSAVLAKGEVMVDSCTIWSGDGVGKTLAEFNDICKKIEESGISEENLKILSQTYLIDEIVEKITGGDEPTIIDFDAETEGWMASDFYSEDDKGRVLYELGYKVFPAEVPEALIDYVDYAMAWRDAEVNMGIRCVSYNGGHYLVF